MGVREQDVFCTAQLNARPIGKANYVQEKQALQELARCMVDEPNALLARYTELAMEITGAQAGGVSVLETEPAPGRFRWRYTSGASKPLDHVLAPRNYSPCGVTLDKNAPVLANYPGRYYTWITESGVDAPEVLLVPLNVAKGEQLGTLWAISSRVGHFHRGHARVLTELSTFVAAALQMANAAQRARLESKGAA